MPPAVLKNKNITNSWSKVYCYSFAVDKGTWVNLSKPFENSETMLPFGVADFNFHFVVSNPSIPTGPLAWIRDVLIPTSAPSPNRKPSAKRVLALWNTQALSTSLKNLSAIVLVSVMIVSCKTLEFSQKFPLYAFAYRVAAAVTIDVIYCLFNTINNFNSDFEVSVFFTERFGWSQTKGLSGWWSTIYLHSSFG